MKNHLRTFLAFALILSFAIQSYAQDSIRKPLSLGKIEPYRMEVTYDKTSHLIFPTAIRYVDLGSEYLIAGKAEDALTIGSKPDISFLIAQHIKDNIVAKAVGLVVILYAARGEAYGTIVGAQP